MGFHLPRARLRREATEEIAAESEDRAHARAVADRLDDWLEPARDAAVERVVLPTLIMGLVRLALDRAVRGDGVDRVATTAIAAGVTPVATGNDAPPAGWEYGA